MNQKLAFAALAAVCFAFPASAESSVSNVISTLVASPPVSTGACPAQITFAGDITVQGRIDPASPVEIGYTFLRSDGATGPVNYLTVREPGSRRVETTWTLGGPSLPNYAGWEQLKAWPTRHLGFGYSFSPRAEFRVACAGPRPEPRFNIAAELRADPPVYEGRCPGVITFRGEIVVTGAVPSSVQLGYTFLRSDNATGPVKYIDVTRPGSYPVEETWTLGGPGLPRFAGWEQLKVWPTRHEGGIGYVFSPRGEFRLMRH